MVKVSVIITTYKHENFIGQCIESVLSQEIDFNHEILVGVEEHDESTIVICKEYENQFPNKIRVIINPSDNVIYIKGKRVGRANFLNVLKQVKGEYFARCDGDDYWTDRLKLQKQVDFLDNNKDYILCGAKWRVLNENKINDDASLSTQFDTKELLSNDFIDVNYAPIHSSTVMFRNDFDKINFPWKEFVSYPMGDVPLFFIFSLYGKVARLNEFVSVYRKDNFSSLTNTRKISDIQDSLVEMLVSLDELSSFLFSSFIAKEISYIKELTEYEEYKMSLPQKAIFLFRNRAKLNYTLRDVIYILRQKK